MDRSRTGFLEVVAMITTIWGVVPFSAMGSWEAQSVDSKLIWLFGGLILSTILLGFSLVMRHLRIKEDAERVAAAEARAQTILNKAKALTLGMRMSVCGDGVFCEPEVHDPALAGLALELGAAEKPLVPPMGG